MGFDLAELRSAVARHGRVARVVIAAYQGSSPREVGAAMLVWNGAEGAGQSGTIGGGALEFHAAKMARDGAQGLSRHPLGPEMGQCCGGVVQLLCEQFDAGCLPDLTEQNVFARPVSGRAGDMPLPLRRMIARARAEGRAPAPRLDSGWMIEPLARPSRPLWIWGAGHVGRALVDVLSPLPEFDITWIDTAPERFPADVPAGVTALPAAQPAPLAARAGPKAEHLVLTYSHALDLEICHSLLTHGFARAGLIGSRTKWARFRSRLAALGHSPQSIARVTCPIGDPSLGKAPQAIAIGVAAQMLRPATVATNQKDRTA